METRLVGLLFSVCDWVGCHAWCSPALYFSDGSTLVEWTCTCHKKMKYMDSQLMGIYCQCTQ